MDLSLAMKLFSAWSSLKDRMITDLSLNEVVGLSKGLGWEISEEQAATVVNLLVNQDFEGTFGEFLASGRIWSFLAGQSSSDGNLIRCPHCDGPILL